MSIISNEELERRFDAGEDLIAHMDLSTLTRPNKCSANATSIVSADIPDEMIRRLDVVAKHLGVSRETLVETWLTEKLDLEARKRQEQEREQEQGQAVAV